MLSMHAEEAYALRAFQAGATGYITKDQAAEQLVEAVRTVPRGETASYREIAELAGHPRAPRSAGAACARGPLSIVVPYHRVIRADGGIGEYGELGAERKLRLLALEGVHAG